MFKGDSGCLPVTERQGCIRFGMASGRGLIRKLTLMGLGLGVGLFVTRIVPTATMRTRAVPPCDGQRTAVPRAPWRRWQAQRAFGARPRPEPLRPAPTVRHNPSAGQDRQDRYAAFALCGRLRISRRRGHSSDRRFQPDGPAQRPAAAPDRHRSSGGTSTRGPPCQRPRARLRSEMRRRSAPAPGCPAQPDPAACP